MGHPLGTAALDRSVPLAHSADPRTAGDGVKEPKRKKMIVRRETGGCKRERRVTVRLEK